MTRGAAWVAALALCLVARGARAAHRTAGPAARARSSAGLPAVAADSDKLSLPAARRRPAAGPRLTARRVGRDRRQARQTSATSAARYPGTTREVFLKGTDRWQVSYLRQAPPGAPRKEIAQVLIDDRSGVVLEAWTGYKVAWTMARGYPGAFGRDRQLAVGVDPARGALRRAVRHAAPAAAPAAPRPARAQRVLGLAGVLQRRGDRHVGAARRTRCSLYLLGRMLWIGLRRGDAGEEQRRPLHLLVPVTWLAIALIFLLGFRVALNVTNSNVIDVGYAGVIGADRLVDGQPLYGAFPSDNASGDTYGPVVYEAYVPVRAGAAVERQLGRPARGARRGDRLRPARLPAVLPRRPPRPRARPRDRPRLRVGGVPVHALRPDDQRQRRARRRCSCSPRCWPPAARRRAGRSSRSRA